MRRRSPCWALVLLAGCGGEPRPSGAALPDIGPPSTPDAAAASEDASPTDGSIPDAQAGCRRVYVDPRASGRTTGSSWRDALTDLDAALALEAPCLEVWIAEGTYRPGRPRTAGEPRSRAFVVSGDVRLRGGFAGDESSLEERDTDAHPTILSGDLANDDDPEDFDPASESRAENANSVIVSEAEARIVLDGLIVEHGHNDRDLEEGIAVQLRGEREVELSCIDSRFRRNTGAGLSTAVHVEGMSRFSRCRFEHNHVAEVPPGTAHGAGALIARGPITVEGCRFEGNVTSGGAGAGYLSGDRVTIRDSDFTQNRATGSAGALWIEEAQTLIEGSRFVANEGASGGALLLVGTRTTILRSHFRANVAVASGGAIKTGNPAEDTHLLVSHSRFLGNRAERGGALRGSSERIIVSHSTFSGNEAAYGAGAMYFRQASSGASLLELTVVHSTIVANAGGQGRGGGLVIQAYVPDTVAWSARVHNSVLAGNVDQWAEAAESQLLVEGYGATPSLVATDNLIEDAMDGANIDADPVLVDPEGADGEAGTEDDDLRPAEGSPCIDAGDAAHFVADEVDVDGDGDRTEPTPTDLAGGPRVTGAAPDLGAYESASFAR